MFHLGSRALSQPRAGERAISRQMQELAKRTGDRRGAVAVMVALVMVAIMGMLALALDVAAAVSAESRLQEAADVAALMAVRQAAVMTAANSNADLTAAQNAAVQRFTAQASSTPRVMVNGVTVDVIRDGLTITSTVRFDATYATQVAGMLGAISPDMTDLANLSLGGQVGAKQQIGAYVDVQVLMDVSNSMTIAATDNDASLLSFITSYVPMWYAPNGYSWQGCTFACHANLSPGYRVAPYWDYNYDMPQGVTDYYTLAHYFGVSLRIDVVKQAVNQIVGTLNHTRDPSRFRFGFYTFDNAVYQIYPLGLSEDVGSAVTNTEVSPVYYCCVDYQTNVDKGVTDFSSFVSPGGDGSSQIQAKKYVVIITDGINDHYDPYGPSGRTTATFSPQICQALKNKNVGVFVLQAASSTQFPTNDGSDSTVAFNASVTAMQQCASPGLYYLASDPADILAAAQAIINLAVSQPAFITQGNTSTVRQ